MYSWSKTLTFWVVVLATFTLYIVVKEVYEPRVVYACHEVDKDSPRDVQEICERLTKRRILK
jgi:hypothetical protein